MRDESGEMMRVERGKEGRRGDEAAIDGRDKDTEAAKNGRDRNTEG